MATMKFKGLDEYLQELQRIERNTPELLGKVVYGMADVVADEVRKNIDALPAEPDVEALKAWAKQEPAPITIKEKKGLQEGFGIAPMIRENGYYHVKLGFDGYNDIKTKKYPKGQPHALIARAIESGSSIRYKYPFIRPAVNKCRKAAEKAGQTIIDNEIHAWKEGDL